VTARAVTFSGGAKVGLLAARPASGTQVGQNYFATDDQGGTLYLWDGSAWQLVSPRGRTLAQSVRTTDLTGQTNTAYADVSGVSITFTPRSVPFTVECWIATILVGGTFNAYSDAVFVYQRLVNADASTIYLPEVWETLSGNLYGTGPLLFRRYFDVGEFTPNTSMTVKLQARLAAVSVESANYAINARTGIRAIEDV
jgi:hypothetical protein